MPLTAGAHADEAESANAFDFFDQIVVFWELNHTIIGDSNDFCVLVYGDYCPYYVIIKFLVDFFDSGNDIWET